MLCKTLISLACALLVSASALAEDAVPSAAPPPQPLPYVYHEEEPPWLPGSTDAEVDMTLPCQGSEGERCVIHPQGFIRWGGLTWFLQGFYGGGDHDCSYEGRWLVVLVAPLSDEPLDTAMFAVMQKHRVEECDWGYTDERAYRLADLDADGVEELCIEELRERHGSYPDEPDWAHAVKRRALGYRVDARGVITRVAPELEERCPGGGYTPLVEDTTARW